MTYHSGQLPVRLLRRIQYAWLVILAGASIVAAVPIVKRGNIEHPVTAGLFLLLGGSILWSWLLLRAINQFASEMRKAQETLQKNEEQNRFLIENIEDVIWIWDTETRNLIYVSPSVMALTGYTDQEILAAGIEHIETRILPSTEIIREALATHKIDGSPYRVEAECTRKDGSKVWIETVIRPVINARGVSVRALGVIHNINHRRRTQSDLQVELKKVKSLREIDAAIINNMDLETTLSAITTQVSEQLSTEFAQVFLYEPNSQSLIPIMDEKALAITGPNAPQIEGIHFALKSVLERRMVISSSPNPDENTSTTQNGVYCAVPFLLKNAVKGVLLARTKAGEIPDGEWLDFFEALAAQATIAIEKSSLVNHLRQSNEELMHAYETTLFGWSRALDLRDKETEGHTQRVVTLTMQLAKQMGFSEEQLVQIRRGALLHDIGKMGVPDRILLKPEALSDEEWTVMRNHPVYAYQLIYPIDYLRPALDIPYYHHERWDGSGYPNGLKGEEIPLVARIFTVVDIWDALTSDRPYRPAWTQGDALAYIRDQAGKILDPVVVELFLKMMEKEQNNHQDKIILPMK